jgi:hypothetical protein
MLVTKSERCMCQGRISVRNADECDIALAVRTHNAGPQHQAYMLGVILDVAPHSVGRDGLRVYVPRPSAMPGEGPVSGAFDSPRATSPGALSREERP